MVTGGFGFIGSHLVKKLLAMGHSVVNIDLCTYAANPQFIDNDNDVRKARMDRRYTARMADICQDTKTLLRIADPDIIFHLAAESHVDNSIAQSDKVIQTNIVGTHRLLEAVREAHTPSRRKIRFVHVSTDEVYGSLEAESDKFNEGSPYDPRSPYSASKAASDHLVSAWHHTYGVDTVITHCTNNFGPNQHQEKLIPTIIAKCLDGEPIPVYGDGKNIRDWIWVGDHVAGLVAAGLRGDPGRTYDIGAGCEKSNLEIVDTIRAAIPGDHKVEFVTDRPGHDFRYAIDPWRAESELGWRAAKSFEDGIAETVKWYQEVRA